MNVELQMEEPDLVSLIGSRICHDLVSPVGAIGNGVELLGMSAPAGGSVQAAVGPELDLVRASVDTAQAKLRFYRIAFGEAGKDQKIGRGEVLAVLADLYGAGRLKVHWDQDGAAERAEVKLAFLMLMCLENAMPFGGQVHVRHRDDGWCVQGTAEKLRLEPLLWEALKSGVSPAPLRPSQVQFGLVTEAAARLGRRLDVALDESSVTLCV